MTKGEIVLIVFPFTDLSSTKLRPAVVLINSTFDLTVCFITSQLQWQESTDLQLSPNFDNGFNPDFAVEIYYKKKMLQIQAFA